MRKWSVSCIRETCPLSSHTSQDIHTPSVCTHKNTYIYTVEQENHSHTHTHTHTFTQTNAHIYLVVEENHTHTDTHTHSDMVGHSPPLSWWRLRQGQIGNSKTGHRWLGVSGVGDGVPRFSQCHYSKAPLSNWLKWLHHGTSPYRPVHINILSGGAAGTHGKSPSSSKQNKLWPFWPGNLFWQFYSLRKGVQQKNWNTIKRFINFHVTFFFPPVFFLGEADSSCQA